ncbi:MAG: ABC transporter ATP-binding protein [Pirellulaceae bacterium]|nr:ABC transporter ATP-binding protein [Pirellulaceae bacterium]
MVDVQLSEIEKSYGNCRVLATLNLHVAAGQYVVLLGPSGCGKTTLLKIIAGLEQPDHGQLCLGGNRAEHLPPRKRDVSIVFQHDALYPHLSIRDSIAFGLKSLSASERRSRIDQACQLTGIASLLDRRPDHLSGGELRRAAIAKAIARRASVRLLDEPLSAIDSHVRHGIANALIDWHTSHPGTTIHVTHNGQEAMHIADLIAVMGTSTSGGNQIVQLARPEEIYRTPANKSVALSIGSPPMSFLGAKIKQGQLTFTDDCFRVVGHWPIPSDRDQDIEIGMRSNAIGQVSPKADVTKNGLLISGTVTRTYFSNDHWIASVKAADQVVLADFTDRPPTVGDHITLYADCQKCHLFDTTGQSLAVKRPR